MRFGPLLTVVLLLSALAAGAAILHLHFNYPESQGVVGRPLIAPDHLDKVGLVHIEGPTQSVTLRLRREVWSIDEQDGFPANTDKLGKLLILLTGVRISQKIKVRPERLGDFGLLRKVENNWKHEKGRTARVLTLTYGMESRDRLMDRLLIGKHRPGGRAGVAGSGLRNPGHGGTYIRYPSTNSVYLVTDPLRIDTAPEAWIDPSVFHPDSVRAIRSVRWRQAGSPASMRPSGPSVRLYRPGPEDDWQVQGAGDRTASAFDPDALAEGLAALRVISVLPPDRPDAAARKQPLRVFVSFFDGRIHQLTLWPSPPPGSRARAELSATLPIHGAPEESHERVRRFNARFSGRQVLLENVPAF